MLFRMFRSRIIASSVIIIVISCGAIKVHNHNVCIPKDSKFKPDTTVNGLALRNEKTVKFFFTEFELLPESEKRSFPSAYFYNINSTEYLAIYHYHGDLKDEFSLFEVGYSNKIPDTVTNHTTYGFFMTENKIRLGITKKELLKIKGSADTTLQDGEGKIMRYLINDLNAPFLKRYNMPAYFAEYYIERDTVVKFRFGFEYP